MIKALAAPAAAGARLLVVDDELHVRSALARSLSLLGYRADEAASGRQALALLETAPYDLILLDIRMPGMDGVEVMGRARQVCPDLMIVILTGHATLESAIAAVRSGAADYLIKPASVHDIAAVIASALQKRAEKAALSAQEELLCVGPVALDCRACRVVVAGAGAAGGCDAILSASQTALLAHLMRHANTTVSCRELAGIALGYRVSEVEAQRIIRPHIYRLRRKIEPDPHRPRLIRTVSGKGYIFTPGSARDSGDDGPSSVTQLQQSR